MLFLDTIPSMRPGPRFFLLLAPILALFLFLPQPVVAQHWSLQDTIVITDVNIVDVRTGEIHPDQVVVIEKNRITAVGSRKDTRYPRNAPTILNARGGFLIPGLWDMHVHLVFGDWFPRSQDISLPLFVANGVTSVRDMGSELAIVQSWRNDIEAGLLLGPRILTSGPMLDGPKPRFPSSLAIATPEDGRRAVVQLKQSGADFIKLQSLIPREAVFAIAEEARKQEIPFEGHVPDSVLASEMSTSGMHSFEHLIGIFEGSSPLEEEFLKGDKTETKFLSSYDPERASALATLLAKNQTWQCPTLVWERGGNLIDVTDFSKDPRVKYVPASWKDQTWKNFTEQVKQEFNTDDLETRKKFIERNWKLFSFSTKPAFHFLQAQILLPVFSFFPDSACTRNYSASSQPVSLLWKPCRPPH